MSDDHERIFDGNEWEVDEYYGPNWQLDLFRSIILGVGFAFGVTLVAMFVLLIRFLILLLT